jgi:hypothetical protein
VGGWRLGHTWGGLEKIDWNKAPFFAYYKDLDIDRGVWRAWSKIMCGEPYQQLVPAYRQLSPQQARMYRHVWTNSMIYDYCTINQFTRSHCENAEQATDVMCVWSYYMLLFPPFLSWINFWNLCSSVILFCATSRFLSVWWRFLQKFQRWGRWVCFTLLVCIYLRINSQQMKIKASFGQLDTVLIIDIALLQHTFSNFLFISSIWDVLLQVIKWMILIH